MTAPNIVKSVITLTILHHADYDPLRYSLEEIGREISEGEAIGVTALASQSAVAPGRLTAELEACGNDGSFFGEDD